MSHTHVDDDEPVITIRNLDKQYKPNDATTKLVRSNPDSTQRVLFHKQKSCYGLDLYDIYSLYIHGSYLNLQDEDHSEFCIVSLTESEKRQCLRILKKERHPNMVAIETLTWTKWLMVTSILVTILIGITMSGTTNYQYVETQVIQQIQPKHNDVPSIGSYVL